MNREWIAYLRDNVISQEAYRNERDPDGPAQRLDSFLMGVSRADMSPWEQRLYAFHEQPLNRDRMKEAG